MIMLLVSFVQPYITISPLCEAQTGVGAVAQGLVEICLVEARGLLCNAEVPLKFLKDYATVSPICRVSCGKPELQDMENFKPDHIKAKLGLSLIHI